MPRTRDYRTITLETPEDDIKLINSVFPEFELWWEKLWGSKKGMKLAQKKEGS
jgi:hypothetical protein